MEITPETLSQAIKGEFIIGQTILSHKKSRGMTQEHPPNEGPTAPPSERDSVRRDLLSQRDRDSTFNNESRITPQYQFQHKRSNVSSPSISQSDTRNFNIEMLERLNSDDVAILEGIEEEQHEKGSKYKSSEFDLNL